MKFTTSFSWHILVLCISSASGQSVPLAPADASEPLLVWDVAPAIRSELPRNFRTTDDPLKTQPERTPNLHGLDKLRASGSAEFTPAGLKLMLARLPKQVVVFDLRQEDHLFINNEPVSWMATNNWANVGKRHDDIVAAEKTRAASFKSGQVLQLSDDRAKKGGTAAPTEIVKVEQVETEADIVQKAGAAYFRLTVTDHCRSSDEEVDRFISAVRTLPADAWVHFHCRAGKGRTTTFLALYDMLRNATAVSLEDIVERQSRLMGDYNLLAKEKEAATSWKAQAAADRAAFIRTFYDYARANPGGKPQLWTEWLATRKATP